MAMPYARNAAFAGDHTAADGNRRFHVFYVDRAAARGLMAAAGSIRNTWHPDYIPCGWRWQRAIAEGPVYSKMHGPFSSSHVAYKDAMRTLAEPVA